MEILFRQIYILYVSYSTICHFYTIAFHVHAHLGNYAIFSYIFCFNPNIIVHIKRAFFLYLPLILSYIFYIIETVLY